MNDKSIIQKFEGFLKLNNLKLSESSAMEFVDLDGNIQKLELSMEYVKKGNDMESKVQKDKYFKNALLIDPTNFAAKICLIETGGFQTDEYPSLLSLEHDRLITLGYMEDRYYKNKTIDYAYYQETFNYLRGLRSYYLALIPTGCIDKAIQIGEEMLELNPSDFFKIKSSLSFLYLREKDTIRALQLVDMDTNAIIGTKELILAYSSFLNSDIKKSLEYLSNLEAINPFFYRLLTEEASFETRISGTDIFADSVYLYLSLRIIDGLLPPFSRIVNMSKNENPLFHNFTKDEKDILELAVSKGITHFNPEQIQTISMDMKRYWHIFSFPLGRIVGTLESLEARGVLKNGNISPYGRLCLLKIEQGFLIASEFYKKESEALFSKGEYENGILSLEKALEYTPGDLFLKKKYLFHKIPFDFSYARNLIQEMNLYLRECEAFKVYTTVTEREKLIRALDDIYYFYFKEAYQISISYLIESYEKVDHYFEKYNNLISMAKYILLDSTAEQEDNFYLLYKEYKEKGLLSYKRILENLKSSKIEFYQIHAGILRIPYEILDTKFHRNYLTAVEVVDIPSICSLDEMEFLDVLHEGGKSLDEAKVSFTYFQNAKEFEKNLWIIEAEIENTYQLSSFIEKIYKKTQKK